ncbi:MAG TPA: winged helix-turn-helix domain-containing protein [Thermoanaerobaculia bacterium]|nr:winged helix-turn-helix domain-containing protein [Thermoanaerobaculia bacterium]
MIHRFESFELDTDRYELRHEGRPRAIEPQVFALLAMLIENRHRMVPREEIIGTIWAGRAVSDSALSSRIKSARQALDDDGNAQRLIRTVHGQGFRFVGEVESVAASAPGPSAAPTPAQQWTRDVLARPVLAVLPFENEGGRAEDAYFADGIAEELISELSSWRWFPILSRDSSFDRSRAGLSASARAASTGARYAVTGRLLRAGDSSRLTVELLDTASDTQLWSARYSCGTAELAGLHPEIASEIFQRIAPELTSEETRRVMRKRHEDLTAWDMTIKGLWHLHRATQHDFSQAIALLEDATRVDPGFAMPWSFIALARFEQALKGWTSGAPGGVRDAFRGMLEAASTSVELDPASWMGHALMSAGELWTNLSFPRARLHANRALELNPSASMAHHFSGCISGFAGDLKGAIATQGNVYRVDPQYGHADVVEADLGLWRLLEGELERADEHLQRAISINPSNLRAWQRQIVLAGLAGKRARAREALGALKKLGGNMDEQYLTASYPFQNPRHAKTFRAGLVAAGVLHK